MEKNLKNYLLHLRDILQMMPYLSPRITIPMLGKWILSFRPDMEKAVHVFRGKKHHFILNYLESRYGHLVANELTITPPGLTVINNLPIWVFWYQGEDKMPPLVKLCFQSVKRNACGRPVHLLDKDNMLNYVDIPDYILDGVRNGRIGMACFSDILRLSLLAKHGGHWLDATLFVNKPLSEENLNPYFESIKMQPLEKGTISDYRWSGFCLYAKPGASTMKSFRDVMLAYFNDGHKRIIDYLLIDYTFQMMYERCEGFRRIIDYRPYRNEYTYALDSVLNKPYSPQYFEHWKDQQFFKLSWKSELKDGDTMFHWLEKRNLNN